MNGCVFCDIIRDGKYDKRLSHPGKVAVFEPLRPHCKGHLLVIPWLHVRDAAESPPIAGMVAIRAAQIIQDMGTNANLITSVGTSATQSVFHLHWHIVPRREGDGLLPRWPWQCGSEHDSGLACA